MAAPPSWKALRSARESAIRRKRCEEERHTRGLHLGDEEDGSENCLCRPDSLLVTVSHHSPVSRRLTRLNVPFGQPINRSSQHCNSASWNYGNGMKRLLQADFRYRYGTTAYKTTFNAEESAQTLISERRHYILTIKRVLRCTNQSADSYTSAYSLPPSDSDTLP